MRFKCASITNAASRTCLVSRKYKLEFFLFFHLGIFDSLKNKHGHLYFCL